jgi:hypothetical protein
MQFTRAIAHLFDFAPSGRKLPRPDSAEGDAAQRGASAAAGQAGIDVRGLLEAPSGDRNLRISRRRFPERTISASTPLSPTRRGMRRRFSTG